MVDGPSRRDDGLWAALVVSKGYWTGVFELKIGVLAGSLALVMLGVQARPQAGQDLAQQAIPDAPKPQATLPNLNSVAPGMGTTSTSSGDEPSGPSANTPQPASSKVVTTP